MTKWRTLTVSFCIMMFFLSACASTHLDKPIASFQKGVDESVGVIGQYYVNLNDFERTVYLEEVVLDPEQAIQDKDAEGNRTPLIYNIFSQKGIKARLDCLSSLSIYAKRLGELAGSKAPTDFSKNTKVLGDNLSKLSGTFGSLTGTDPTASKYIGPISTLVGVIGEIYLEKQQETALKKAIGEGDPVVRQILTLLESDLVNIVGPVEETGAREILASQVSYYNEHRKKMSLIERRQAIDEINSSITRYTLAVTFNPSSLISSIADAHQALVKYAASEKKDNDFSELISGMEVFTNRVDTVAGTLQKLQGIK